MEIFTFNFMSFIIALFKKSAGTLLDRKKLRNNYITVKKTSVLHTIMYRHNKITASFDHSCVIKLNSEAFVENFP
jgi:hypothetical protein